MTTKTPEIQPHKTLKNQTKERSQAAVKGHSETQKENQPGRCHEAKAPRDSRKESGVTNAAWSKTPTESHGRSLGGLQPE
jgi:hypothetical protein